MKNKISLPIKALVVLLLLTGSPLFGQSNKRLTMKGKNLALVDAFKQIEKQADVNVAYNASQISKNNKVNIDVVDQPLENVLSDILKETGFSYKMEGSYIVVVKEDNQAPKNQESKKRTGVINDEFGSPLPGVSIVIKGTTTGMMTDIDGKFSIDVPDNTTLVFSYVGFIQQEMVVGSTTNLSIQLNEDVQHLNEVIVVGYNTVKLGQVTGSLKIVDGKQIEKQSSPTLENRLQGKIAGVMISGGSGQPGSDNLSIRIRGTGSINGSNTPLYIMDGVMVEPAQFASLNSNDIADIQILKDASSTAIYGSRGANGVVVITTKAGKAGKTNITYSNQFGISVVPDYIDMMNGEQNLQYQLQCAISDPNIMNFPMMNILLKNHNGAALTAAESERLAQARATDTDWIDEMTRNGFLMDHNVSVSGGSDQTKFYISGSFLQQDGVLKKSDLKRYSGRFNLDHKVNKHVELGVKGTIGFSEINFSDPTDKTTNRTSWANPWFTALLAYPYEDPETWINGDNPTMITKYYNQKRKNLKGVFGGYVKVNILDWLHAKTNFGMDYMNNRSSDVLNRKHPKASGNKGSMSQGNSETSRYTWTNTLNAAKDFANGHSVSAVVGMEMFQGQFFNSGFTGYDIDPYMMNTPAGIGDPTGASLYPPSVRGGKTKSNIMSYFSQIGYAIGNKYNLSGSLRHDTSSKFAKGNRSAMFWSLGGSWSLSNEDFLKDNSFVNYLRLRASYGTNGNQDGVSDFQVFDGYAIVGANNKGTYAGSPGYIQTQLGNPDLQWETSAQANIGLDFSTWKNRLNITLDVYHKKTQDLFMAKAISATSGFRTTTINAGSVINKGIELGFDVDVLQLKDFNWNIGANLTYNKNELADLGTWTNANGFFQDGHRLYQEGKSLGTWRMPEWAGVNPDNGLVEFYDANREKTTNISNAEKMAKFKSSEVPLFGGFNTTASYKGLTFSADFTYAANYYVMNATRWYIDNHNFNGNKPVKLLDMWMKPGDITNVPRYKQGTQPSPMASQFLEDASYIRLKTVRLNYDFPSKLLKSTKFLGAVSVYAQAENVHTWTGYTGADPEVNGDTDRMSFPKPRNFTFGVNVNF